MFNYREHRGCIEFTMRKTSEFGIPGVLCVNFYTLCGFWISIFEIASS
jgi:hypothetical protein